MRESWDDAAWEALARELDAWRAEGQTATVWWRDDDAGRADPGLDRLLALAMRTGLPLGLAVVPAWLTPEGAACIEGAPPPVAVLQHGFAHANHETVPLPGSRKVRPAECGAARPVALVLEEIRQGWGRLRRFGPRLLPVFVPPWNRIAPVVRDALPTLGFRAVSAFGSRGPAGAGPVSLNCHVDPIVWRAGTAFLGAAATLDRLRAHLAARRTGAADPSEPTGLLTHHRDMDEPLWEFLAELLPRLATHPAVRFPPVGAAVVAGAPSTVP